MLQPVHKPKRIPSYLHLEAKRFLRSVSAEFQLSDGEYDLVLTAAEQLSRKCECRDTVNDQGLTIRDRFGVIKPHPCLEEERKAAGAFRLLLREAALDYEGGPPEVRGPRAKGYE